MSQFTSIETKIYEEHTLKEVIKQLGYELLEDKELIGYGGAIQHVDFQVKVRKGYNIGFRKEKGAYKLIADRFMNPSYNTITSSIIQTYATRIVMRNVEAMGYTTVKRTVDKDNTIKLVLVKR